MHSSLTSRAHRGTPLACWLSGARIIPLSGDYYQVGLIVAGGLYFGLVRLWTGSVNLTILVHMIMNFVATIETMIQVD
jgi:membrane protease YdiL (CAAX protease family)